MDGECYHCGEIGNWCQCDNSDDDIAEATTLSSDAKANDAEKVFDPINHPSHYVGSGSGSNSIECIDALESIGIAEDVCRGSAIKYLWRMGSKSGNSALQDAKKAQWYVNRLVGILERASAVE